MGPRVNRGDEATSVRLDGDLNQHESKEHTDMRNAESWTQKQGNDEAEAGHTIWWTVESCWGRTGRSG
jgi:hypothetical protein